MALNGKSYYSNPNAALFSVEEDDDIDDELFLKNSRKPQPSSGSSQIAQLQARRENIENNTLASTQRSLSLLRESEQVGVQTAQELAAQREQLERSSRNLDSINSTLRTTQRNIDGIKSVFSSLKNYLTGPKESNKTPLPPVSAKSDKGSESMADEDTWETPYHSTAQTSASSRPMQEQVRLPPRSAQAAIDENLSHMSSNIGNLRGLALNLGNEILEQNELLDSMQYKADQADVTIQRQNTQMNRLLGKKDILPINKVKN